MDWLTRVWSGESVSPPEAAAAAEPVDDAGPRCPGYQVEPGFDYVGGDIGLDPSTVKGTNDIELLESFYSCK